MPHITVRNLTLEYPLFGLAPRHAESDENVLLASAGAVLADGRGGPRIRALDDVSFHVESGDRLGIVGRNGSGKSTLLRVLGGIHEPSAGGVEIEGEIAPMFNVGLGMRVDSTGRRNVILRGLLKGLTKQQAEARIPEIEAFSGLGGFLDMPVRTYSHGMAMRLAFAMGTAFEPEILLLDEWIGAGDQEFRDKANKRMRELVEKAGIVVLASHNPNLIRSLCNKTVWIHKGKVEAFGATSRVFEDYVGWCKRENNGALG